MLTLRPPTLVDPPDGLGPEERRRVIETVTRAIERAAAVEGVQEQARWAGAWIGTPETTSFSSELAGAETSPETSALDFVEADEPALLSAMSPPAEVALPAGDQPVAEPPAEEPLAAEPADAERPAAEAAPVVADEPELPGPARAGSRAVRPRAPREAPPAGPEERPVQPAAPAPSPDTAPPEAADERRPDPLGLPTGPTIDAGQRDRIVRAEFPRRIVAMAEGQPFLAGGSPYVVAGNFVRASVWGRALFGGRGYAVLHSSRSPDRFYVVGMTEPLTLHDLGGVGEELSDGVFVIGTLRTTRLVSTDFTVVEVETVEDWGIFETHPSAQWSIGKLRKIADAIPASERNVDPALLRAVGEQLLPAGDESAAVDVLVNMDRTMFAAMPWERRADFLRILVDAWTGDREETAILEIIQATRATNELEAIFALLRQRGVYGRLFRDLDGRVLDLLVMLGELRSRRSPTWQFLVEVLVGGGLLEASPPKFGEDRLDSLVAMAEGAEQWLRETVSGLRDLLTRPDVALEGLEHLVELLWTIEKARWGDPDAQAVVGSMAAAVGRRLALAFDGLEYADELGTATNARGAGEHVSGAIIGRIRGVAGAECASWFIGIGEIKAALESATLAERIAALAKALRGIRLLGRLGRATASTARLEHVLVAFGRVAKVEEVARLARIAEALPKTHVEVLQQIVERADLTAEATTEALRATLRKEPRLLAALDPLIDAFVATSRLEARATEAGITVTELLPGLHRLMSDVPLRPGELAQLIDTVPAANLRQFMRSVGFMSNDLTAALKLADLVALSERPAAMHLLTEAGSDVLQIVRRREAGDWARVEELAGDLERHHARFPAPDDWQRFLDRIKRGDTAALDEAAEPARIQRLAEARAAGTLEQYVRSQLVRGRPTLLRTVEEAAKSARAGLVEDLANMSARELDGLEQLARVAPARDDFMSALELVQTWERAERRELLVSLAEGGSDRTATFLRDISGTAERGRAILDEFAEAQRIGRPGYDDQWLGQPGMSAKRQPKRARPSGEPVAQFEIGNFSHAHAEELCPELPRGLHREVWIDRGPGVTPLRADRVDFEKRVVYEVKPDNGYWRAKGEEQLRVYKGYMDHQFPPAPGQGPWETKLVTYDYESALRTLKKWGYLK